jgi:hypothetical protein
MKPINMRTVLKIFDTRRSHINMVHNLDKWFKSYFILKIQLLDIPYLPCHPSLIVILFLFSLDHLVHI